MADPQLFGKRSPIAFAATNLRHISQEYHVWSADLKACRHDVLCRVFEGVLFFEAEGLACILGLEAEDGLPKDINPEYGRKQQEFVEFLRKETARDCASPLMLIFEGSLYMAEACATAAYIAARNQTLDMGIGYRNNDGKYETVRIDPADDVWLEKARATPPFDELC